MGTSRSNIGFNDVGSVLIDDGDLEDYSTNTKFTAEEVFSNIKKLSAM